MLKINLPNWPTIMLKKVVNLIFKFNCSNLLLFNNIKKQMLFSYLVQYSVKMS